MRPSLLHRPSQGAIVNDFATNRRKAADALQRACSNQNATACRRGRAPVGPRHPCGGYSMKKKKTKAGINARSANDLARKPHHQARPCRDCRLPLVNEPRDFIGWMNDFRVAKQKIIRAKMLALREPLQTSPRSSRSSSRAVPRLESRQLVGFPRFFRGLLHDRSGRIGTRVVHNENVKPVRIILLDQGTNRPSNDIGLVPRRHNHRNRDIREAFPANSPFATGSARNHLAQTPGKSKLPGRPCLRSQQASRYSTNLRSHVGCASRLVAISRNAAGLHLLSFCKSLRYILPPASSNRERAETRFVPAFRGLSTVEVL